MNITPQCIVRTAACATLLTMLAACEPPPPPDVIGPTPPSGKVGLPSCPSGYQLVGSTYSMGSPPPANAVLGECVSNPPSGWYWVYQTTGTGTDSTVVVTGACNTQTSYCGTY
jgi:hypothetical protein